MPAGNGKAVVDGPQHDGHEITVDLAPEQQFRNIGSKLDGAGMCVFTSIEMAARAQGLEQMRGYRDWWASVSKGGGWPDQVDKSLKAWFKHKGIQPIPYVQYEGKEPERVMSLIDKTGRMACITYGWGERYGTSIAHMVCSPGFRGKYGVVLDNNFVAKKTANGWDENIYEWMDQAELCRRMKLGSGAAWIFVWLPPPPPPAARNRA
jgi:hypothetical protein